ncbi:MAG: DUF4347 domain-containing protein [Desulfobacteraceae bacterium]|nr:DUF4347 domain-containing protein [Desulfobacteraceae bacterium]
MRLNGKNLKSVAFYFAIILAGACMVDNNWMVSDVGAFYQSAKRLSHSDAGSGELVIISADVPHKQQLLTDLKTGVKGVSSIDIMVLDLQSDGICQIDSILSHYKNIQALHLIVHGSHGFLELGSTRLDQTIIDQRKHDFASWTDAFAPGADLLIYACDVAALPSGRAFIDKLAIATGLDIAASTNPTGHQALGGDWDLEYTTGSIEAQVYYYEQMLEPWIVVLEAAFTPTLHEHCAIMIEE